MKPVAKVVSITGVLAVAVAWGVVATNPLRRSEEIIKARLLASAPLGTSIDSVRRLIRERGWRLGHEWRGEPSPVSREQYPGVDGSHILFVYMGHYQGLPWRADVESFWGFDTAGQLVGIHVRKTFDAL